MLKAVIFPQRGVELILIGIKLFACHQFHKLVIAGALFVELRLDLLKLVAHALELFVERSAGLGLGALLLLGLFALGRFRRRGGGVGLGGAGFGGLGRGRRALPCGLGGGAGCEILALVEVVVVVAVVDRDLAISLRKPVKTSDSKEKMQETYDVAEKVFLRIMDDLDNTTEPEDIVTTEPETTAVTTVTTAKED